MKVTIHAYCIAVIFLILCLLFQDKLVEKDWTESRIPCFEVTSPSMYCTVCLYEESIEWFIEEKAVSPSYDLAPPPPPPTVPPSPVSRFDRRHTGRLRKRDDLLTGEEGGGGGGAKSFDGEKAWSSLNIQNSFDVCALENICTYSI